MVHALSGSIIKGWFQYRCERKVRYEAMSGTERQAIPVLADDRESPWAVKGVDFEDRVVSKLASEQRVLRSSTTKKANDRLPDALAIPFLTGKSDAHYAAQVNIAPRELPEFLKGLPNTRVSTNLPDLIRRTTVNGKASYGVVDIKATRRATAFHKAQVAFYALLLEAKLKELGHTASISPIGEIWRFPDLGKLDGQSWTVEAFELDPYRRQVISFCEKSLPDILASTVSETKDDTFFHVYFKCEQCKFLPHCLRAVHPQAPDAPLDTSAVAGMSHQSKKTLAQRGVRTVASLAAQSDTIASGHDAGWRLSRSIGTLIGRAKAITDDAIMPGPDEQSYLMPARTDVALYLSADFDAIDGSLATLGYLYVDPQGERFTIRVIGEGAEAEGNALVDVFSQVVADLAAVDAHNRTVERNGADDPLQAHIFVFEPAEAVYLQDAVKRHLGDQRVRDGLLNMVRLFPPDEVIPEPEFRGIDHLPATALRSVIEQLFALPVRVSHDLGQVSVALNRLGDATTPYKPLEPFARPFSSMLAIDIIQNVRDQRANAVSVEDITADVLARLRAARGVAEWLFREHDRRKAKGQPPMLRLRKKPFRLQESFDPLNASDLDVLTALELLESRSGKLETLINLSRPKLSRRTTGRAIGPLKFISEEDGGRTWILETDEDLLDTELSSEAFGLILSDGEPASILEPALWDAFGCSIKRIYGKRIYVQVPAPQYRRQERKDLERKMSIGGNADWWIDQAFKDLNTDRVQAFVRFLGGRAA